MMFYDWDPQYRMTIWPGRGHLLSCQPDQHFLERAEAMMDMDAARRTCKGPDAGRPDPLAPPEGYGQPEADDAPDLTRCAGGAATCTRTPEYVTWVGCTSEHVGPVASCEEHARQLHSPIVELICGVCHRPQQILRTEPELPRARMMDDLLSRVFGGRKP